MKIINTIVFFLFLQVIAYSQELTGLWMGELTSDSTGKKRHFELALSEYRGKVTGYSYTTFFENDRYYYSIKRIKSEKKDTAWIIEDDKMVGNNFPEKVAKGVKQTITFTLNKNGSSWEMSGRWHTNQTKLYYALTGTLQMHEEKNTANSNLFPLLEELNLQTTVSFYAPEKKLSRSSDRQAINKTEVGTTKNNPSIKNKAGVPPTKSVGNPAGIFNQKNIDIVDGIQTIAGRKIEIIQTVSFKSDSLVLALYDNGEIDGDTVSVFMNGEILLSRQGLKATAIKKTIYVKAGTQDSLRLILFAENLGSYPPNTGLLVVHDGEDVYQIRFSADFERSPAIVFKRKTK